MAKSEDFILNLPVLADKYMRECIEKVKEVATGSGKIVEVKERNIPTIEYFLHIWLPIINGDTIHRDTYYEWLKSDNKLKSDTIKVIDDKFKALATDIVANEGKGIFYAKNKLGMTDKQQTDLTVSTIDVNFGAVIQPTHKPTSDTQ